MAEAKVKAEEAKEKTVQVRLPRAREGDEREVFVGVNGRAWRIKKGETVEVPECVAEVLRNSEMAMERADEYEESLPKGN